MNPLLITPKNYKDEGLRGFVWRAAYENGYKNPKMVVEYADIMRGHRYVNLLVSKETINLNKLCSILRTEKSVLEYMELKNLLCNGLETYENEFLLQIWRYGTCANRQRICPLCLKEKRYVRLIWDISLYTVCHVHNCLMIESCSKCGKQIKPMGAYFLKCDCNFAYQDCSIIETTSDFSLHLFQKLYNENKNNNNNNIIILNLHPFYLIYLIIISSHMVNSFIYSNKLSLFSESIQKSYLVELLDQTFSIFMDWPHNFFAFLDNVRKNKHEKLNNINGPVRFRDIRKYFILKFNNPHFSFIRHEFDYYLKTYWKEGYLGGIQVDDLSFKKIQPKISALSIRKSKAKLINSIDKKAAARLLGVGLEQIDLLRERGLLKPINGPLLDGEPTWNFDDSVNILLENIEKKLRIGYNKRYEVLNFRDAVRCFQDYELTLTDLIFATISDDLIPIQKINEIGVNQYCFYKEDVQKFIKKGFVTIDDISLKLNIKRDSIVKWIKLGFFNNYKKIRSDRVTLIPENEYDVFFKKYTPVVEVVRKIGTIKSSVTLIKVLASRGIKPITKKEDGCHYLLENTADLDIFIRENLVESRNQV